MAEMEFQMAQEQEIVEADDHQNDQIPQSHLEVPETPSQQQHDSTSPMAKDEALGGKPKRPRPNISNLPQERLHQVRGIKQETKDDDEIVFGLNQYLIN